MRYSHCGGAAGADPQREDCVTYSLLKGDAESSQIYEIHKGFVAHTADGAGKIGMSMHFNLDWYIYEGEGEMDPAPERFEGTYTVCHAWEGDQQVLYVGANERADPWRISRRWGEAHTGVSA